MTAVVASMLQNCLRPGHSWQPAIGRFIKNALEQAPNLLLSSTQSEEHSDLWMMIASLCVLAKAEPQNLANVLKMTGFVVAFHG